MNLNFKEITKENWEKCVDLTVSKEQANFVAPNWYSILQSKFESDFYPLCIYDGDVMIGFLMYDIDPDTKRHEMSRLMIDHKFQGKGYGKIAITKLLELIRNKYGNINFYTSIEPNNIGAQKLYESLGFKKTGEIMWDEVVMVVKL
ncbi:GNAT family N-acetyltransferase [Mycoplasmatota bacterium]|nr:GNAT family N-acetyltransferase [Mycoplasmatota bacterium]